MRIYPIRNFLLGTFTLLAIISEGEARYLSGGYGQFSEESQARLDQHADILTLGINIDWLTGSHIDPDLYVRGIDVIASSVQKGEIPGAVIYVDSIMRTHSDGIPHGIGYLMTDPQKHRNDYDSMYYVGDMTGPLLITPLVVQLLGQDEFSLDLRLGEVFSGLELGTLSEVDVRSLLRQSSGLKKDALKNIPREYTPEEILIHLAAHQDTGSYARRVEKSSANFLVLTLLLERYFEKDISKLIQERIFSLVQPELANLNQPTEWFYKTAPGEYSETVGRMLWAEPGEPIGLARSSNSGFTGFTTSANDLAAFAHYLTILMSPIAKSDPRKEGKVAEFFKPDVDLEEGEFMGLGFEVGKYGRWSFGYDADSGSSLWILPERAGFIIYLSNPHHPSRKPLNWKDPRREALPLFEQSLNGASSKVDTPDESSESDANLTREKSLPK